MREKLITDRKISLIINLTAAFVLFLIVCVMAFIYWDDINVFFGGKKPPPPDLTNLDLSREPAEITTETESATERERERERKIPQYGEVPLGEVVADPCEYFKNSIFLGDSVTSGFDLYRGKVEFNGEYVLKDVTVIADRNYGVYYALQPISAASRHPLSNGRQTFPEDIIAQKDADKVFICLGLNDLTFASISDYIVYYSRLIEKIKEKSPEKTIVIMSVTPLVAGQSRDDLNNDVIVEANDALLKFALENDIYFMDYAAAIRDGQNCLPGELSSDGYCHLLKPAYDRIVEYMLYHPIIAD